MQLSTGRIGWWPESVSGSQPDHAVSNASWSGSSRRSRRRRVPFRTFVSWINESRRHRARSGLHSRVRICNRRASTSIGR